jgi:Fur family ferric uptake transcriptional regulator
MTNLQEFVIGALEEKSGKSAIITNGMMFVCMKEQMRLFEQDLDKHNVENHKMELPRAKKILQDHIRRRGLRNTPERYLVLEAVLRTNTHFDADELYVQMVRQGRKVSRTTVYKTLELLLECGLVMRTRFSGTVSRYETTFGRQQHDHLICVDCGMIFEFVSKEIEKVQKKVCQKYHLMPVEHSLQIYGRCEDKEKCPNLSSSKKTQTSSIARI